MIGKTMGIISRAYLSLCYLDKKRVIQESSLDTSIAYAVSIKKDNEINVSGN